MPAKETVVFFAQAVWNLPHFRIFRYTVSPEPFCRQVRSGIPEQPRMRCTANVLQFRTVHIIDPTARHPWYTAVILRRVRPISGNVGALNCSLYTANTESETRRETVAVARDIPCSSREDWSTFGYVRLRHLLSLIWFYVDEEFCFAGSCSYEV